MRPAEPTLATVTVPDDLRTIAEVASYFRVCERTIREWRDLDATFPAPLDLLGRLVRWYRQDVIDWALSLRGAVV